jgi:hypothetical protein
MTISPVLVRSPIRLVPDFLRIDRLGNDLDSAQVKGDGEWGMGDGGWGRGLGGRGGGGGLHTGLDNKHI